MKVRAMVLGMSIAVMGLAVAGVEAGAASSDTATAAKKKRCKKGFKRVGRKCRKKKPALPAAAPKVRATLTWGAAADVDLHIWDANGLHSGFGQNADANGNLLFDNQIPNSLRSPDAKTGPGPETFTDGIFIDSPLAATNRLFTYGVCPPAYYANGQVIPIGTFVATLTYIRADGTTGTAIQQLSTPGQGFVLGRPPGGHSPTGNWCR